MVKEPKDHHTYKKTDKLITLPSQFSAAVNAAAYSDKKLTMIVIGASIFVDFFLLSVLHARSVVGAVQRLP